MSAFLAHELKLTFPCRPVFPGDVLVLPCRHFGREGRKIMGHSEFDPGAKRTAAVERGPKAWWQEGTEGQAGLGYPFWLDHQRRLRDRAMFDLAIDSKLRGCDVVKVKIADLVSGGRMRSRAIVVQQKTGQPVQFELLEPHVPAFSLG